MSTPNEQVVNFRKVFESSACLQVLLTADCRIIAASDAYLAATYTKRDLITGQKLPDIFPASIADAPDIIPDLQASLMAVLHTGQADDIPVRKYYIQHTAGRVEERMWSVLHIPVYDDDGGVQYIIHQLKEAAGQEVVSREEAARQKIIDEFKAIERLHIRHIKESEERFYKIFNLVPVPLLLTDGGEGRIMYVNASFEHTFGIKSGDAAGRTAYELGIAGKARQMELIRTIQEEKGGAIELELDVTTAAREARKVISFIDAIELDNKKYYLTALLDITERKKMETSVLRLNKELEAFTYSVSHDLRAPLRAVTGYARMLDEDYSGRLDAEGKRLLRTISQNAERMGALIDDLLAFSRLGRKEIQKTDVDMNELVDDCIKEIKKSTVYSAIIETDKLPVVKTDRSLMKQVMINLLSNAIKYSSKVKAPIIKIKAERTETEYIFSVQDNGVGFDMRYAHKLFGVFQRLHSMEEFEGSGVGLAIVQRIIHKHEGRVWAQSSVDEGATFYFSIPIY